MMNNTEGDSLIMKIKKDKIMAASGYDPYTENLADFGMREIEELRDILDAWLDSGLPDDFYDDGVRPALNRNSGYVFLTNSDYQVCMVADGKLESFYTTPYSGIEGFYEDLVDELKINVNDIDPEDVEFIKDLAEAREDEEVVELCDSLLAE